MGGNSFDSHDRSTRRVHNHPLSLLLPIVLCTRLTLTRSCPYRRREALHASAPPSQFHSFRRVPAFPHDPWRRFGQVEYRVFASAVGKCTPRSSLQSVSPYPGAAAHAMSKQPSTLPIDPQILLASIQYAQTVSEGPGAVGGTQRKVDAAGSPFPPIEPQLKARYRFPGAL